MPTYEYQCRTCGNRFDYFQSISAEPLTHCPVDECLLEGDAKGTGDVVRRISGGAGLVFKGEGFYLTDYVRKGDRGKEGGASSSGGGASKSDGGGSSDGGASGTEASGKSSKDGGAGDAAPKS